MKIGGSVFNSREVVPRNGIAGSYSHSMFNFLRHDQNVFHSPLSFTIIYFLLFLFTAPC